MEHECGSVRKNIGQLTGAHSFLQNKTKLACALVNLQSEYLSAGSYFVFVAVLQET